MRKLEEGKGKWKKKKQKKKEQREVLFEMKLLTWKYSFETLTFRCLHLSYRKEVACLIELVDPPLCVGVLISRCQNQIGGRHPYFKEASLASFFLSLSEQLVHLIENCVHLFKLAFHFCIFLFSGHYSGKGPALLWFPVSSPQLPFRCSLSWVNFCLSPISGNHTIYSSKIVVLENCGAREDS